MMNIDMTTGQIIVALFILCACGVSILLKTSTKTFPHEEPCWNCNETDMCKVCPVWNPTQCAVNSAYVVRKENGKVVATSTLTFKEDFVVAQSPAGGDNKWEIPNLVGHYKTSVDKWASLQVEGDERNVTFS